MRIVLTSHAYAPDVGGIETASRSLAREFVKAGHEVVVVTQTPGPEQVDGIHVVRRPTPARLIRTVRSADAVLQNNVGLRTLWAALLLRKPTVVSLAGPLTAIDGSLDLRARLKRRLLRRVRVVAVSQWIADATPLPATVIHNSYRDDLFRVRPDVPRDRDLVFLGRLVSDKGVDVLLDALERLAAEGVRPDLTVIGDGPERPALEKQAGNAGLEVRFTGPLQGEDLVGELNRHRVMVVPSTWEEPFGIVALEGLACGCTLVVSRRGGLVEAAGPCALTFENGDAAELVDRIRETLDPATRERLLESADAHLADHCPAAEAARHLALLEGTCR